MCLEKQKIEKIKSKNKAKGKSTKQLETFQKSPFKCTSPIKRLNQQVKNKKQTKNRSKSFKINETNHKNKSKMSKNNSTGQILSSIINQKLKHKFFTESFLNKTCTQKPTNFRCYNQDIIFTQNRPQIFEIIKQKSSLISTKQHSSSKSSFLAKSSHKKSALETENKNKYLQKNKKIKNDKQKKVKQNKILLIIKPIKNRKQVYLGSKTILPNITVQQINQKTKNIVKYFNDLTKQTENLKDNTFTFQNKISVNFLKKRGPQMNLHLSHIQKQKILDYTDEFMSHYEQLSESWQRDIKAQKRF